MLALSYAQAAWFRARRTGLAAPFPSLPAAAAGLLGAQAQIEVPARWSLALRVAGTPTASEVQGAIVQDRSLIRAWGQRDTVHLYATEDWALFAAAQTLWPVSARRGGMPTERELADFVATAEALGRPFTRSELLDAAPGRLVDAFRAEPVNDDPPERMAITRLIWAAGHSGDLCATHSAGREQAYAARRAWVPDLVWRAWDPEAACVEVARRYLAAWGPARPQDLAHYVGARVSDAKRWCEALADATVPVSVDGLPGHLALRADLDALAAPVPEGEAWPARLLPAFDTQMMSHAHKDPLLAKSEDRPKVWAKAAQVNPTVFHRGRFQAVWKHEAKRKAVHLKVEPLSSSEAVWSEVEAGLQADGARLAKHLGVEGVVLG